MGVVFALTLATSMAVRKPKTWGDARRYASSSGSCSMSSHLTNSGHSNGRNSFSCQFLWFQSRRPQVISPCLSLLVLLRPLMECGAIQRNQNGKSLGFLLTFVALIQIFSPYPGCAYLVLLRFLSFCQSPSFISLHNPSFVSEKPICIFFGHVPSVRYPLPLCPGRRGGRTAVSRYEMWS
jgi:hypothetical protein